MEKTHHLYFIEVNRLLLMYEAAIKAEHIPGNMDKSQIKAQYEKYKYEFAFKLNGLWKVSLVWCYGKQRETPKEMGALIADMIR